MMKMTDLQKSLDDSINKAVREIKSSYGGYRLSPHLLKVTLSFLVSDVIELYKLDSSDDILKKLNELLPRNRKG